MKKGLKITVVIILLAVLVFGLLGWNNYSKGKEISDAIQGGADAIELRQKCLDITLKDVSVVPSETSSVYDITFGRGAGDSETNIEKVQFNFFNSVGENSGPISVDETISPLDTYGWTVDTSEGNVITDAVRADYNIFIRDGEGNLAMCPDPYSVSI
ncbi:MAG: hypothetical protein KJ879_03525 [Nanoarchaeota archaeon]|nr:hypothetical protein [Nanoarchaeota archaeon]